jgi:hypothetical protein
LIVLDLDFPIRWRLCPDRAIEKLATPPHRPPRRQLATKLRAGALQPYQLRAIADTLITDAGAKRIVAEAMRLKGAFANAGGRIIANARVLGELQSKEAVLLEDTHAGGSPLSSPTAPPGKLL